MNLIIKGDPITPFINPPIGKHYTIKWKEDLEDIHDTKQITTDEDFLQLDGTLYPNDTPQGPFWPRLLSALIPIPTTLTPSTEMDIDTFEELPTKLISRELLEEALVKELKFLGIILESDVITTIDQDEISLDLIRAQQQLKTQINQNTKRKEILYNTAGEYLAYQEYLHVLDALDKRIQNAYDKKFVLFLKFCIDLFLEGW